MTTLTDSEPMGLGRLTAAAMPPLTLNDARLLIAADARFDYVRGRPIKVDLRPATLEDIEFWLYDRDNGGPGTGEAIARSAITACSENA